MWVGCVFLKKKYFSNDVAGFLVWEYQITNICWIIKKARQFQKNMFICFIDYAKAFDCVDHNKLEKS